MSRCLPALRLLGVLSLAVTLSACVNKTIKTTDVPPVYTPQQVIPEGQLLDVGIVLFDPGIEDMEEDEQVYPEVRRAEARFMPRQLAMAMQDSGAWGAVRVLPDAQQITDLTVTGRIVESHGEALELELQATDSRGVTWLDQTYSAHASRYAYDRSTRIKQNPFQAVYNHIANDLLEALKGIPAEERRDIRLVSELAFARQFSPDAFNGYLETDRRGHREIVRLPAADDPMLERVRGIRKRDHLFIDTLQEYYATFSEQMDDHYQNWRELTYEEVIAMQELKAQSRRRLIAGGAARLAGIVAAGSDSRVSRTAGNVAILGGGYLLKSGLDKRNEAEIHVQALEELSMSLEADVAPQVIELQDKTVTLSGNVQEQYDQWRSLLAEIYRAEIGALEPAAPADEARDR